jgi:spore germination cell wall hydrolase CwlJ-like protein
MAASSVGLLIGASFGAVWLGGHVAHEASLREQADQIQHLSHHDGQTDLADLDSAGDATIDSGAMSIASRFSRFDGQGADNALQAQSLSALRTSSYVRGEKALALQASLRGTLMDDSANATVSDHPVAVRAASSFKFAKSNQNDLDCLNQAVYYEARGEGQDGMRAVAQVIVNRVRNPSYPKSVCAVVYQGAAQGACQFSFACNDAMAAPVERSAWRRARDVARAALDGYVMKDVGTATSFHTVSVNPGWSATMQRVATIGSHIFYQFRGHGARLSNDVQPSAAPQLIADRDADPAPVEGADKTALLNALSLNAAHTEAAKPVAAAAQINGQAARDIAAAVATEKAPAKTPTAKTAETAMAAKATTAKS